MCSGNPRNTKLPTCGSGSSAEVRKIIEAIWRAVRAHPNAIPLLLTRRMGQEATLRIAEALLGALARGGLSGRPLLAAFRTLNGFVMGLAQQQLAAPISGPGESLDSNVTKAAALAVDRYPKLREIAAAAALTNSSQEFQAGLEIILRGIALEQRRSA